MSYTYHEPESVGDAIALLERFGDDAFVVAGATAFTILWKQHLIRPSHVVGLRRCGALRGIEVDDGWLRLGAMTTHRQVVRSPAVRARMPVLSDGFRKIASVRIQNQATLGGNLAHGDPAQDPPTLLSALGATVLVAGPDGDREIPIDEFFVDYFVVDLRPAEILVGVRVPPMGPRAKSGYWKFRPGTVEDYATVAVAAAVELDDEGRVATIRITLGAVGSTPVRARGVEDALHGTRPTTDDVVAASELVRDAVDPTGDARGSAGYKREMARTWTARALLEVLS